MEHIDLPDEPKPKKRKQRPKLFIEYLIVVVIAVALIAVITVVGKTIIKQVSGDEDPKSETQQQVSVSSDAVEVVATLSAEEQALQQEKETKQAVIDSYQDMGLVQVSGYVNIRETPDTTGKIIGKLSGDSACEIVETIEDWYKITSGGIEGYIHSKYVLRSDEAKEKAADLIKKRAFVNTEMLNIRKEPNQEAEVVGQALKNERYEVVGETEDGWIQIPSGYIFGEYAKIDFALNEARKLDLKAMVLNMYTNMGISNVENFLNVREEAKEDGKIIGKMPSNSAGEILETLDGWYKIQSGPITGYVKSDFILTGQAAKEKALESAELMAIVSTDALNVRTEPSTASAIWTQLANKERYSVKQQMDGWVEIDLEEDTTAYVATDFVDVRYALAEAVKFSPLEEKANAEESLRTQIVNFALQFLGNRYVWGGTSLTKGADCSGFTQSVMKNFGVSIPRVSGDQSKHGKKISSDEMRPGDLIFYANSRGTVNHVSLYIGNGQIIHAASRKSGIKLSSWNYRKPVGIRNVID